MGILSLELQTNKQTKTSKFHVFYFDAYVGLWGQDF